jgi:hypothetical protein
MVAVAGPPANIAGPPANIAGPPAKNTLQRTFANYPKPDPKKTRVKTG